MGRKILSPEEIKKVKAGEKLRGGGGTMAYPHTILGAELRTHQDWDAKTRHMGPVGKGDIEGLTCRTPFLDLKHPIPDIVDFIKHDYMHGIPGKNYTSSWVLKLLKITAFLTGGIWKDILKSAFSSGKDQHTAFAHLDRKILFIFVHLLSSSYFFLPSYS